MFQNAFTRRNLIASALAVGAMSCLPARGQRPKTLRVLVGFPPGGGTDAVARLLSHPLEELLGMNVIIDNRPGAGGQIAAQALKSAPADGSVVFLTHDHTISILPLVLKDPGFDPARDFTPVGGFASFVNALALSADTPAQSFTEFVDWVRRDKGGQSAVGIPAPASTPEFLVGLISKHFKIDLVAAPYRGSAPMMADMMGNHIPAGIGSVQDFIENHRAGKLRVAAVLGGKRQAALPDVPTFAELGLSGFEDMPYYGFYAPAGVPAQFIKRFADALAKSVAQPQVQSQLKNWGLTVDPMTPAQLGAREHAYTAVWRRIIEASGFHPQ